MASFAEESTCAICYDPYTANRDACELNCGHTFCRGCIVNCYTQGVNRACPYCRGPLVLSMVQFGKDETSLRIKLRADPDHGGAHFYLGGLLVSVRKDYAGAAHEYREAIRCNPINARYRCGLDTVLRIQKRQKRRLAVPSRMRRVWLGIWG
jgi:hypothetical protein